jgi:DNA repair protein RadD
MIPTEGDGRYRRFLADAATVNPNVRTIGLTATPFRLKTGMICTSDHFLNQVCYEVGVRELIHDGYLSPLLTKEGSKKADTSGLHVRAGEYVTCEVEELMDQDDLVESACAEIIQYTADRKAVLIFATSIKHGRHIVGVLGKNYGVECGFICDKTPDKERKILIERFKTGKLKYLCNINVLTMGFDAPIVDCVALLRPTISTGLYYQMVGRGFRLHPGKENCLVLDFGGNVLRHGPVDQLQIELFDRGDGDAPIKQCPRCNEMVAAGYMTCPACDYKFPPPELSTHEPTATSAGILSGQSIDTEYEVHDVIYRVHTKRGADPDAPKTLRVDYRLGLDHWQSDYICIEHDGYARQTAVNWWKQRSPDPVPKSAEHAVEIAEGGGLAFPKKITVRSTSGEKFDRIVDYTLGPIPDPIDMEMSIPLSEIPF